jgi:hypothetical protein
VPRPPEMPPGVRNNTHISDIAARIAVEDHASLQRQYVHAAQVALGFQTEPALPLRVALEGRVTTSSNAHAGMTTSRPDAPDSQALHQEMLQRIAALEEAMTQLVAPKPGR